MNHQKYFPVPLADESALPSNVLSEQELKLVKKASRSVIFLCIIQLLLALFSLVCGGLIMMVVSAIFISIGIVGAAKQRVRLLTVHFVYSLVLYVLSLIGVVLLILYCDGCKWWIYVIGFFVILFQAVGMRHSRILICLLKKKNGQMNNCILRVSKESTEQMELCDASAPVVPPAINGNMSMFIPLPAHQVMTMPMQPNRIPYFPVQPVQYPIMQHPPTIFSTPFNNANAPQQPFTLNPVVYKI